MRQTGSHRKPAGRRSERGQALVIFILSLSALLAIVALVIDMGLYMVERRHLQNAADAAALAAARDISASSAAIQTTAVDWAARNGYSSGDGATVQVQSPYQGDADKVEVTISKEVPALFARALGQDSFHATARAVASRKSSLHEDYALVALNPTACGAFTKGGSNNLVITGGGAIGVNSSCATAIDVSGPGRVSAGGVYYYREGGWRGSNINPTPQPMDGRLQDPLAWRTKPSLSALSISPDSGGTAGAPAVRSLSGGDVTLHPGVYYGGLNISGNSHITFATGVYIMAGGGFSVSGGGLVTGTGVTVYNTFDPQAPTATYGVCGNITLTGGAGVHFQAPASGPYQGILFWQDPACTNVFTHAGNGMTTSGIYYLPTAQFRVSGTSDTGGVRIIADTILATGNAYVELKYASQRELTFDRLRLIE